MLKRRIYNYIAVVCIGLTFTGCKLPGVVQREENTNVPAAFSSTTTTQDTINSATVKWKEYFKDPNLVALIDTALANNQELNITLQEIEISRAEVRARKGEYLPFLGLRGGAGVD